MTGLIRLPIAVLMVWVGEATLAAAERCRRWMWPRTGLVLIDIGEACGRVPGGCCRQEHRNDPRASGVISGLESKGRNFRHTAIAERHICGLDVQATSLLETTWRPKLSKPRWNDQLSAERLSTRSMTIRVVPGVTS
jgi:hypothetical protein